MLPVFLNIKDGKRLHLALCGATVVPPVQRLLLTPTAAAYTLEPAPIGDREPPVQVRARARGWR